MTKAAQLTTKTDQLAFSRQCRAESAEALERYRTGQDRRMVNDVDVTQDHMKSLRQIIRDLDAKIEKLEAHG